MDDPVQGQEPQGGGSAETPTALESDLQTVPEEYREHVAPILERWEKNTNARLQEAAELKKTLGPYQEIQALSAYQPEQLSELLAWHQQVTSSEDAYRQWLTEQAQNAGLTPQEEQQLADAGETGELSQERIEQIIEERSQQRLQPLEQQLNQLVEQQAVNTTEGEIRDGFARFEKDAGKKFSDEEKEAILELGINEQGDNWLEVGLDRWNKMTAMVQKAFVDEKAGAPGSALSAGGTEAFKATTDSKEAGEMARSLFRSMQEA